MAKKLSTTLLTDGPRDQILIQPISWLLSELAGPRLEPPRWADPRVCNTTHSDGLAVRLRAALDLYRCDLLFVHRDAEKETLDTRRTEIEESLKSLPTPIPAVCVVPVRMTEAWFLFDSDAVRLAANNPAGNVDLNLPPTHHVETLKNPKEVLEKALRTASGLSGRRLATFRSELAVYRLAQHLDDYGPLAAVPAFATFRSELAGTLEKHGWLRKSSP